MLTHRAQRWGTDLQCRRPIDEVVNLVVKKYGNIVKLNHYMMGSTQIWTVQSRPSFSWIYSTDLQQNHEANYLCTQIDLFLNVFTAYKYHKLSNFTVIINVEQQITKLAGCFKAHYEQN